MKQRKKPKQTERIVPLVKPELDSPLVRFSFNQNNEEVSELQNLFNELKQEEAKNSKEEKNEKKPVESVFMAPKPQPNPSKPKFNLFNIPKFQSDVSIEAQQNPTEDHITESKTTDQSQQLGKDTVNEVMGYNKPLGFGILRTYQYLVKNHMLYKQEEDLIEHKDEFGNKADFKSAFKAQSHRFAGRYPGAKKRQKQLEKSAAKARMDNQLPGDTPLQSGKALREMLEQSGTAHIELTGENKSVIPYIPQQQQVDKAFERKKKRLKKVKKVKKIVTEDDI